MNTKECFRKLRERVYLIVFVNTRGETIASGTGFWANNHLITNNHVFAGPDVSEVLIRSEPTPLSYKKLRLSCAEFKNRLVAGSMENAHDYAVLDVPELRDQSDFAFNLVGHSNSSIGDSVVALGFPFGRVNLTIHQGSISSYYKSGVANAIQIDMSINQSNSGGPLVNSSGDVIGIVTRKTTGLTQAFNALENHVDQSITELMRSRGAGGSVSMLGIDPIQRLLESQQQMKRAIIEIRRSANVGIGTAFSVDDLMAETCFE